jgi:uncharacterized protein YgiM (DUF1202 family)
MLNNRRTVLPVLLIGFAMCFAIISLPLQSAGANGALQGTQEATVNPCNPQPTIAGHIVATTLVVYDKPANNSTPLIIVKQGDVVEVLGKNSTAFWVEILTHAGITGWAASPYVAMNKTQFAKLPVVDENAPAATAAPTMAATMEGTMAATEAATPCPGVPGTVTADSFVLKAAPSGKAKDAGVTVKKGDQVQVIALNSSGSWFEIMKGSDTGWIGSAYVFVRPGSLANTPHDYTDAEVTLTPVGQ